MSGSNTNNLTNPAVPNNTEVPTLLIEKFNGKVHEAYGKGENLLTKFMVNRVVGTNMVSNKYIGETELQVLTPGQEPEATTTEFNKNALIVDTTILGRNVVSNIHDIQNDFDAMSKLASNQVIKLKQQEDQMVLQQLLAGGFTGGTFDPHANTITGGVSRVAGQGVSISVDLKDDNTQALDPYQLLAAIEIAIMGLVVQRVPVASMEIVVPVSEYATLVDYKIIAESQGGSNEADMMNLSGLTGTLKGWNMKITGSTEFTQMKMNPNFGETHNLLSNASNGYRYDVTADMTSANAIIFGKDGLLAGETISLQGDIFFDKKSKGYFVDSWYAEGCIPDRYDNIAIVGSNNAAENTVVSAKAKGKSTATKTYA